MRSCRQPRSGFPERYSMDDDRPITRVAGTAPGRSSGSGFGGLAFAVATSGDYAFELPEQSRRSFAKLDSVLAELGSDKRHLLSVTVYLADLAQKPIFDREWLEWIGAEPAHWPQRACVQAALAGGALVEIVVTAARR
jgi:enamine deaminase RidA (YjgF/YER057c/UK114 family)